MDRKAGKVMKQRAKGSTQCKTRVKIRKDVVRTRSLPRTRANFPAKLQKVYF